MLYNEYLYVQLVNDLMINGNDWSIPYDLSYSIVLKSYKDFINQDLNLELSLYESMLDYINDDETLYASLRELSE